jgi:hypothetical protein
MGALSTYSQNSFQIAKEKLEKFFGNSGYYGGAAKEFIASCGIWGK